MSHSQVAAARLVLPLWTCNWVHSAGNEERGLESKWNVSHRQAKCQGDWRKVGFFPSESRPRKTYGGGNITTLCKVEYFTEGSNYTAVGKCRRVEQNPVGLESSLLFTRREMGASRWNARLGIFSFILVWVRLGLLSRKAMWLKLDTGNNLYNVRSFLLCSECSLKYFAEVC